MRHSKEIRDQALARLDAGEGLAAVASAMNLPKSTLQQWQSRANAPDDAEPSPRSNGHRHVEVLTEEGLSIEGDPASVAELLRALRR
jgi:hypothetical protein